jgi:hypothetical protein
VHLDDAGRGISPQGNAVRARTERAGAHETHRLPHAAVLQREHVVKALGEVTTLQGSRGDPGRAKLVDAEHDLQLARVAERLGQLQLERSPVADVPADRRAVDPDATVGGDRLEPQKETSAVAGIAPRDRTGDPPPHPRDAVLVLAQRKLPGGGQFDRRPRCVRRTLPPPFVQPAIVGIAADQPRSVEREHVVARRRHRAAMVPIDQW